MVSHRLLLTSNGLSTSTLQTELMKLLGGNAADKTCWYIPTAPLRDGWSEGQARQAMAGVKRDCGFRRVEWIDPEYVKGDALRQQVHNLKIDCIWAEMGNTYSLNWHLWNSGGAELIKELVDGGAVYVGSSAGSIMAGRTCQMAFWKNWDDKTCEGTVSADWADPNVAKGLNLAGGRSIFPHANGQYASPEWQAKQAKKHGHTDHEVVSLADGQGIIIEGDPANPSVRVVG